MFEEYEQPRRLRRVRTRFGFGVCHGIANYLAIPVFYVQAGAIILCVITCVWPAVILYVIAALVMKPEPVMARRDARCPTLAATVPFTRATSLQQVKETLTRLDRRIQRMENVVTSREYDWNRRLNS